MADMSITLLAMVLFLHLTGGGAVVAQHTPRVGPSPPATCGTLDLMSPLTQHCFPEDGSHHFVCCEGITLPENPNSPHGNYNPLERVIKAASNSSNYSWCTCSEEICTEQLGGRVAWNMNGVGYKGYVPPRNGRVLYNALTGLPGQNTVDEF